MMPAWALLVMLWGAMISASSPTRAPLAGGPPHILLITTDQQRLDSVSAYATDRGQKPSNIASPHIDKLASEGVRFTDAFAASPVCSPCRTSLLTGVHVPVHGVVENTVKPHKQGLTVFPDVLQGLGYKCFVIGKTHYEPVPASFTYQNIHTGNTDMRCDVEPYNDGSCKYYNESDFLETYLVNTFIKQITGFLASQNDSSRNSGRPQKHYNGNYDKEGNGKFFVHLSFVSPHPPSTPPTEPLAWNTKYSPKDLPALNYQVGDVGAFDWQTAMLLGLLPRDGPPVYLHEDGTPNMTAIDAERILYHGLCAYVDAQVGRAVDFIDEMGLKEDTLVVFLSDHGSLLFDHGGPNDKHSFFDGSWHVPLIMRQPGTLPVNTLAGFASTVDVTASVLVAAGIDWEGSLNNHAPSYKAAAWPNNTMFMAGLDIYTPLVQAQRRHVMEGLSGGPAALGASSSSSNPKVVATSRTAVAGSEYRGYGVSTQHWKLVYMAEQGEGRLFDRDKDPLERFNLYESPLHAEVRNLLLVGLLRWRAQQDDLQWQLSMWSSGASDGLRARNDSMFLTGRAAEYNLQQAAASADVLWRAM